MSGIIVLFIKLLGSVRLTHLSRMHPRHCPIQGSENAHNFSTTKNSSNGPRHWRGSGSCCTKLPRGLPLLVSKWPFYLLRTKKCTEKTMIRGSLTSRRNDMSSKTKPLPPSSSSSFPPSTAVTCIWDRGVILSNFCTFKPSLDFHFSSKFEWPIQTKP